MKKAIHFIIPGVIALIIAGFFIFKAVSNRVPSNSSTTTGNTASNLLNGGKFCESDGVIYFANPYDNNSLYRMDSDCSNIDKLSDNSVKYINVAGDYVYYVMDNASGNGISVVFKDDLYGIVRCKTDGTKSTTLYSGFCTDLALSGNTLVYNAGSTELKTYTIDTKGKSSKKISDINAVSANVYDGTILYSGDGSSHAFYKMDISSGDNVLYSDGNTYQGTRVGSKLYYIDLDNNYALTCMDIDTHDTTILTKDRVVLFNVYNDVIFYQCENNTSHQFKRMNTSGDNVSTIVENDVTSIYCTSEYTFFNMFGSDTIYRIRTYENTPIETFFVQPN